MSDNLLHITQRNSNLFAYCSFALLQNATVVETCSWDKQASQSDRYSIRPKTNNSSSPIVISILNVIMQAHYFILMLIAALTTSSLQTAMAPKASTILVLLKHPIYC